MIVIVCKTMPLIYVQYVCLADSLRFHSITDIKFQKINSNRNLYCKQFSIINDLYGYSESSLSNNLECNSCEINQIKPYLSIRSLRMNFESFQQLLINLNIQPDVIGLTETKFKINRLNYISSKLPGYHFLHSDSVTNFLHSDSVTNSGGVSIFIKANVDFVIQKDLQFFYNNADFSNNLIETVEKNTPRKGNLLYKR